MQFQSIAEAASTLDGMSVHRPLEEGIPVQSLSIESGQIE